MDAHGVGAQRFHFCEIGGDRVPFRFPITFEQTIGAVVVVVEAPGFELCTGIGKNETFPVLTDLDELGCRQSRADADGEQ